MKEVIYSVLVLFLLSAVSAFAGDKTQQVPSPESIVTCAAGAGEGVSMVSVADGIDSSACSPYVDTCAPCITSLEDQGCKFVDITVTQTDYLATATTYLMSCVEP